MSEKTVQQRLLYFTVTVYPLALMYFIAVNNARFLQIHYVPVMVFFIFGGVCLLVQIYDYMRTPK